MASRIDERGVAVAVLGRVADHENGSADEDFGVRDAAVIAKVAFACGGVERGREESDQAIGRWRSDIGVIEW